MSFGWINWINIVAVAALIIMNVIAARKGLTDNFNSKHMAIHILEQIGRWMYDLENML